jgi:hypothetical protein
MFLFNSIVEAFFPQNEFFSQLRNIQIGSNHVICPLCSNDNIAQDTQDSKLCGFLKIYIFLLISAVYAFSSKMNVSFNWNQWYLMSNPVTFSFSSQRWTLYITLKILINLEVQDFFLQNEYIFPNENNDRYWVILWHAHSVIKGEPCEDHWSF